MINQAKVAEKNAMIEEEVEDEFSDDDIDDEDDSESTDELDISGRLNHPHSYNRSLKELYRI